MSSIVFIDEFRHGKVLAVEPSAEYLRNRGHEVQVFEDCREGMRYLSEHAPDILIMGLVLLETSAFEVVRALGKWHPGHSTRSVAYTVIAPDGEVFRDWSESIDMYLLGREKWSTILAVEALIHRQEGM